MQATAPALGRLTASPKEVAEITGLGMTTIYACLGDGRLESVKVGKRRLIKLASVEKLLEAA